MLEASLRKKKGVEEAFKTAGTKKAQQQASQSGRAAWKEGELFPEGWQDMDPIEKATELYVGERGILYWANQAVSDSPYGCCTFAL
jgi:hypothetical protein